MSAVVSAARGHSAFLVQVLVRVFHLALRGLSRLIICFKSEAGRPVAMVPRPGSKRLIFNEATKGGLGGGVKVAGGKSFAWVLGLPGHSVRMPVSFIVCF